MLKIGLVSALMVDNNIKEQINTIENHLKSNKDFDMLIFDESFLQGFEGLTWNYDEDIERAVSLDGKEISQIKELAKGNNTAVSLGLIEKENGLIYSSNVAIDKNGKIADKFRRLSAGWKEPHANTKYSEGSSLNKFMIKGKNLSQ